MARLRRLRQVTICEMALGDENGEAEIGIPLKDGWKPLVPVARVGGEAESGTLRLKIQVRRLDDVCKEKGVGRVDFIKCDTEGFEFSVFSGGLRCLSENLPCVICEIYEEYLARRNRKPSEVFGIFQSLGYRCYRINPEALLVPVEGYQYPTDYLFIHPSRFSDEMLRPFMENPPRAS
jgi:FkbM family methyltransferase